jgi:hypothetical protein
MIMKCVICGIQIDSVDEAIEKGWTPYFYEGEKEYEPACPDCTASLLQFSGDGEMEVREEYRGIIAYQEEEQKEDLVAEIILSTAEENTH